VDIVSTNYCKEILECIDKFTFEDKDAECITQHWDYVVVTHRTVLETAGAFLSDKSGRNILNQQAEPCKIINYNIAFVNSEC
jgi:hypothetical protein